MCLTRQLETVIYVKTNDLGYVIAAGYYFVISTVIDISLKNTKIMYSNLLVFADEIKFRCGAVDVIASDILQSPSMLQVSLGLEGKFPYNEIVLMISLQ